MPEIGLSAVARCRQLAERTDKILDLVKTTICPQRMSLKNTKEKSEKIGDSNSIFLAILTALALKKLKYLLNRSYILMIP